MSVHFVCPSCGKPSQVSSRAPEKCPLCGAALPATLAASLGDEIQRATFPMPTLLMLGRFGSLFLGGIFLLLLLLAPWDLGSYSINNEPVTGPEFLRRAGVAWGVICIDLLAVAYALWTERWWGRWVMMGYWVLGGAAMFVTATDDLAATISGVFFMLVAAGIAAWYLFGKDEVVRYYQMLERRADASEGVTNG